MEKTYKKDTIEIKYRLPKIPEAMRLLPKLGLDSSLNSSLSEWEIAANMIECIEPFILSIKSENSNSWDEAMNDYSMIPHLQQVAITIVTSLNQTGEKKKARKK